MKTTYYLYNNPYHFTAYTIEKEEKDESRYGFWIDIFDNMSLEEVLGVLILNGYSSSSLQFKHLLEKS